MKPIEFNVRARNQTGASYFIKYRGTLEPTADPSVIEVEMVSVIPKDVPPNEVEAAIQSVKRGAQQALSPRGLGGKLSLYDFLLHLVDFSELAYGRATAAALQDAILQLD